MTTEHRYIDEFQDVKTQETAQKKRAHELFTSSLFSVKKMLATIFRIDVWVDELQQDLHGWPCHLGPTHKV
uniref:Putative ovule protein n=1 Tax=Solanum chacoense TaxID=4108 RepID=A0A0V0GZQ5_SOLCH